MPNQRAIAAELGLTQATISMALRNDPGVSPSTRKLVRETADRLGYRPNAYVSSLMARIRAGRSSPERGSIAILYDCASLSEIMGTETFKAQYEGIAQKASDLGFQVVPFFLRSKEVPSNRLERILYTRGINGLILVTTREAGDEAASLDWHRYSFAAISYGWKLPRVDRVASHHRHNVELSFRKLRERGYRRIGMCFPPEGWKGVDANWLAGFYISTDDLPKEQQILPFIGKPGVTPLSHFKKWLKKERPEAIIGLVGHEMEYLEELKLRVPEDIGLACVNRPLHTNYAGVEENHTHVGASVAEIVISGILRNDYGPPTHSKLILIEGKWVDGETLRASGKNQEAPTIVAL